MPKPAAKRKVSLVSLGCPKNRVDSEVMLGVLARRGYEIVPEPGDAETVIVNTCGFIEAAKQESIDTILELAKRKGQGLEQLLVAGCMVNRYGAEMARELPEIDGFIGLDDLARCGEVVELGSGPPPPAPSHLVFDHTAPRVLTTRGHAYLKVAEGCNNPCTFCAIPLWRGRYRSRTPESLVAEARQLEARGAREICLVAQDTTRWGEDLGRGRQGLRELVERVLEATETAWIRFLYAYPTTLDEGLLELMAREERFASYLDIPLQHSHPEILRAMRRGGSGDRFLELLERARALVPDIFLRSTFIVGYPGESDEHFAHLLEFLQQARLDHVGAFGFSPEPGTPGAAARPRVPAPLIRRRHRELLAVQRPIALERRRRLIGRRLMALVEGACDETEHLLQARHQGMAPEVDGRLLINEGFAPPGSFAEVEITEAHADDLVGRIVATEARPEPARTRSTAAAV